MRDRRADPPGATRSALRLAYVFDERFPTSETDAEQVVRTVDALARAGADVELVVPRPLWGPAPSLRTLADGYGLREPRFRVRALLSVGRSGRALEKPGHSVRAATHLAGGRCDLVYTRNLPSLFALLAAGFRVAYETYRPWHRELPRLLGRALPAAMAHPDFVGAILHSEYARDAFLEAGVAADRLEVVHNGFDPAHFEPPLSPERARSELGIGARGPVALYAGRMTLAKGVGAIVEMARSAPEVDFVLVGAETDEIARDSRGLENVTVVPWVAPHRLPRYLYAGDVLIVPPTLDPLHRVGNTVLPMKLFSYLAAGRAILAPRAPDTSELLRHGDNAFLVEPDDPAAATSALATLVADAELRSRLAAGARASAERLTWEHRAERVLRFLETRLASGGGVG